MGPRLLPGQRWLAFQVLHGVAQSHAQGVCHGDIKCENVLLTSWGWVLLADYAPYKPTQLPADNPVRVQSSEAAHCMMRAPERIMFPACRASPKQTHSAQWWTAGGFLVLL